MKEDIKLLEELCESLKRQYVQDGLSDKYYKLIEKITKEYKEKEQKRIELLKKDIRDRIFLSVLDTIKKTEAINKEEIGVKLEYSINVGKILGNYEQLRPTLMKYFSEEIERKKLEIRVDDTLSNNQKREQLKALNRMEFAEDNLKRRSEECWEK